MITAELITYIQQELALGMTADEVKERLKMNGWGDGDIQQALVAAAHPATSEDNTQTASEMTKASFGFKKIFSLAWKDYTKDWRTFIKIQFLGLLLFIILFIFLTAINLILNNISTILNLPKIITTIIFIPLFVYSYSIFEFILYFAIIDGNFISNTKGNTLKVLKISWKLFLLSVFPYSPLVIFYLFFMFSTILPDRFLGVSHYFIINFIPFLLIILLIPAFILFSVWFIFAPFVYISENKGIIESLKRSKNYTRHHKLQIILQAISLNFILLIFEIIPFIGSIFIVKPIRALYFFQLYRHLRTLSLD